MKSKEIGITGEELRLQNAQPLKLAEQISGRIRYGAHRIFRILLLKLREGLMGGLELQVVHLLVAAIEQRLGTERANDASQW
jgi:hypothetical protein